MIYLLGMWCLIAVALVTFAIGRSRREGALTLSYFFALSLIHVPGALAYLGLSINRDFLGYLGATQLGFQVTLLGMLAFVVGAVLARCASSSPRNSDKHIQELFLRDVQPVAWRCMLIGTLTYVVLLPISNFIPSASALVSPLAALLILGIWFHLFGAFEQLDRPRIYKTLALLPLLPLMSLVSGGFMGHGVSWALSVVAFLFIFSRRRFVFYALAPLVFFIGLSVFVTYMQQRNEIRNVVWNSQTSTLERLERVSTIVTDFHFLDLASAKDREWLDMRLNQNFLVGAGVRNHQNGIVDLAYGETIPWWALIPRAIWPNKPSVGGGGTLVTSFTRMSFDQNTSIGVGQVLEFYMNFSYYGVVVGFFALGFLLMRMDQIIMRALSNGDIRTVLIYTLPGLTLLQPGGNLIEILVGVVAAFIVATFINNARILDVVPASRVMGSRPSGHPRGIAASRRK